MPKSIKESVVKRGSTFEKAGLRSIQMWVPDTQKPGFVADCCRQAKLAAKTDSTDTQLLDLMDALLTDIDGWTG